LTAVSIIATAAIGLHALFHDYRKGKKISRAGMVAAALIVLLAAVSITAEMLRQRIEDRNEKITQDRETRQFNAQMKRLNIVSSSLERVAGTSDNLQLKMTDSLATQNDILGRTERNWQTSVASADEARRHTGFVLRRIFEEGNRVFPERIVLALRYQCPFQPGQLAGPVLTEDVRARIAVHKPSRPEGARVPSFETTEPVSEHHFSSTENGELLRQSSVFSGFRGDMTGVELLQDWRDAKLYVSVAGPLRKQQTISEVNALYDPGKSEGRSITCETFMSLFLNGRLIAEAEGSLRRNAPRSARYVTEFEDVIVRDEVIPVFEH
jgi:hypothetical protein